MNLGTCMNCKVAKATKRVWCPTWITAYEGILKCCDKCGEVFDRNQNESADRGQFFFEAEAETAFNSVEHWFLANDPCTENAIGMLLSKHAAHVSGHFDPRAKLALHDNGIYVCDGKVWMICGNLDRSWVCRFGDVNEFKQRFPKLWNMPLVKRPV